MIEMTAAQYENLLRYAAVGAAAQLETANLLTLRAAVDDLNGVTRRSLAIRYQAVPAAPQPNPPVPYPPSVTFVLELLRPITRQDVDEALRGVETIPALVTVTPDPQQIVGWTLLEDYEF